MAHGVMCLQAVSSESDKEFPIPKHFVCKISTLNNRFPFTVVRFGGYWELTVKIWDFLVNWL